MAARRLLIIMVVLLTISTLAAALVPPPEQRQESSTTSTTSTAKPAGDQARNGRLVKAEVSAQDRAKSDRRISVEPGDQLALEVTSDAPGEASVPDLGLLEFAGPGSPARFDLLFDEAGEYPVRFEGAGTISTIVAEKG